MTGQKKEKPAEGNNKQKQEELKQSVTLSEEEYCKLKQEAENSAQHREGLLRVQADFENYRKRLEREKQEFINYANEALIFDLLNIIDDLERTLQISQEKHSDFAAFLKGIEMVLAHFYDLLKRQGLAPIEAKGKIFDPHFHEALLKLETNDYPEDTVVEELQRGYMLKERVIRTAKVKVSKRTESREQNPEQKDTDNEQ